MSNDSQKNQSPDRQNAKKAAVPLATTLERKQAEESPPALPPVKLEFTHLKLSDLIDHKINPADRGDNIDDLKEDELLKVGVLVNPLKVVKVGGKIVLLDGHRRKSALLELFGPDFEAPCILYLIHECSQSRLYSSLNTIKPHRGDQKAAIYLVDPKFLKKSDRNSNQKAHDGLGDERFRRCIDAKISPSSLFRNLVTAVTQCKGGADADFQQKLIEWYFADELRTSSFGNFRSQWTLSQKGTEKQQKALIKSFVESVQDNSDFSPFGSKDAK